MRLSLPFAATRRQGREHSDFFGTLNSKAILVAMTELGGLQVVLALTGLIRNKVAAVYLKTSGMGEWSQILAIATIAFTIVQFGMIVGLSRNTAAATTAEERQRQLSVAGTLTMAVTLSVLLACFALFLAPASPLVLAHLGISRRLELALLLFIVLMAPIEALRNNYLSFLQGILDVRGIATKRSIAVIFATLAAIPLVAYLGVVGACLQFALGSLLLAVLLGQRCYQLGFHPLRFAWQRSTALQLAWLGIASLLMSFSYSWVDVLIRAQLIRCAGLSEAGIYQAAFLLSSQVTQIALGSIGVFSLASISTSHEPEVLAQRLHLLYRVILPISATGLGLLGLLERPVVRLLFSAEFTPSSELLPLLLVANSMQAACWVAGAPLLGCGRVGVWLALQLTGAGLRYVTASIFLPRIGTQAIPLAFFLGQILDLSTSLLYCSQKMQIRTSGPDLARIAISAVLPGVLALIGLHATPLAFTSGALLLAGGAVALAPAHSPRYAVKAVSLAFRGWQPSCSPTPDGSEVRK